MSLIAEIIGPVGRVYRNRRTREVWTIELEIGGLVWLRSDNRQVITTRMDALSEAEWERVA